MLNHEPYTRHTLVSLFIVTRHPSLITISLIGSGWLCVRECEDWGLAEPTAAAPFVSLPPFGCPAFIVSKTDAPLSPLTPPSKPPEAALASASRAFSSLYCRYVLVLGTVSDKNSRLSILEMAVA